MGLVLSPAGSRSSKMAPQMSIRLLLERNSWRMQAGPASPSGDEEGAGSSEEFGFEIPVMSPQVSGASHAAS